MRLVIFAALVGLSFAAQIDLKKVYNDAEANVEANLKNAVVNGATSSRVNRKKFTSFSREMAQRNNIFKSALNDLEKNYEVETDEAKKLAKLAVAGNRKGGHHHGPGGQKDQTKPVTITDDQCEGVVPVCDPNSNFRTINGNCNNLGDPYLGAMSTPFARDIGVNFEYNPKVDLTISYDRRGPGPGGKDGPGGDGPDGGDGGSGGGANSPTGSLPGARKVSVAFHSDNDIPSDIATHMVTQWGQFLDHDITLTPENEDHDCCTREFNATDECFPIFISNSDSFYGTKGVTCLEFSRSVAYCEENGGARQQVNGITSFVDASNVYGSDDDTAAALRSMVDGKLLVGDNNLLPSIDGLESAGDVRALEMPGLATLHTLFVREHNRVCDLIKADNPGMSDEDLYQNARRIVVAEYQSIVYGQYLPVVLGEQNLDGLGLRDDGTSYKSDVNPAMTNEFATAAYRFGHSMIQGLIKMFATDNTGEVDEYPLSENFFNLANYYRNDGQGMEMILMGLLNQPAQSSDKEVTGEVTNLLFVEEGHDFGTDLVARNIQRGRDHGIPSFCQYYKKYDDPNHDCNRGWDARYRGISSNDWSKLQEVYDHPSDIDLFVGGIAQAAWNGGLTGKVFNKMKAEQFTRTKDGDRFFFTHSGQKGGFSREARRTLINRTLAGVICDNTAITAVPSNSFKVTDSSNFISCTDAPSLGDISALLEIRN